MRQMLNVLWKCALTMTAMVQSSAQIEPFCNGQWLQRCARRRRILKQTVFNSNKLRRQENSQPHARQLKIIQDKETGKEQGYKY